MITVTFAAPNFSITYTGERTTTGIGNRRHPGVFIQYVGGIKETGTWYAVQIT